MVKSKKKIQSANLRLAMMIIMPKYLLKMGTVCETFTLMQTKCGLSFQMTLSK